MLSELFEEARSSVVTWQGMTVYSMYELPGLTDRSTVTVRRDTVKPGWPHGLHLKAKDAELVVNGQSLAEILLWSDTAPSEVVLEVAPKDRKPVTLRVWNVWRDDHGTTQAWIGNAGMLAETTGSGVILRCSDGSGEPTFDDFVATIEVAEPA
jgi:hypothetical protein